MTSTRKLLLQASLVTTLGVVALFTAPRAAAASNSCGDVFCASDCSTGLGYINCNQCPEAIPMCQYDHNCNWQTGSSYIVWCGYVE